MKPSAENWVENFRSRCNSGIDLGGFLTNPNGKLDEERIESFIRTLLARSLEEQREDIDKIIGGIIQGSHHSEQAWYDGLRCARESIKKFYK